MESRKDAHGSAAVSQEVALQSAGRDSPCEEYAYSEREANIYRNIQQLLHLIVAPFKVVC